MNPKHDSLRAISRRNGSHPAVSPEPDGMHSPRRGGDLLVLCGFTFRLNFPQEFRSIMLGNLGRRAK